MNDPSQFSNITGQIDYGGKKMPLKPGEMDHGEHDQILTSKKATQPENPIATRYRALPPGYDGMEGVRATEALRKRQQARGRKL